MRGQALEEPGGDGNGLLELGKALVSSVPARRVEQWAEVERRQGRLERGGGFGLPEAQEAHTQVAQQLRHTLRWRSRTLHREGIDDLRGSGRVLGVNAVEEGENIAKEGVGMLGRDEGVEAREGRVVGGRTQQRQAHESAQ